MTVPVSPAAPSIRVLAVCGLCVCCVRAASGAGGTVFRGAADASAAVFVGSDLVLVADDENNTLRAYHVDRGGLPVITADLTDFLQSEPEHPEVDIEGATKVGRRLYWISSHGRNKDGKMRPSRYRFFATDLNEGLAPVKLSPVGRPCGTLIRKLVDGPLGRRLGLDVATRFDDGDLSKKQRESLAPKRQGLNVESLAATPDGKTLYIGFRNPRPAIGSPARPHALVVPLSNAVDVIEQGRSPVFGEPLLWDLQGLGLRAMEYSPHHRVFFLVAGPHDDGDGPFVLYRWSGSPATGPLLVRRLSFDIANFKPEALLPCDDSPRLLLLSDDGTIPVEVQDKSQCAQGELNDDGTCPNKFLVDATRKTFRGLYITP